MTGIRHKTVFYDDKLKFDVVMEDAMKSKAVTGPNIIDHGYVI